MNAETQTKIHVSAHEMLQATTASTYSRICDCPRLRARKLSYRDGVLVSVAINFIRAARTRLTPLLQQHKYGQPQTLTDGKIRGKSNLVLHRRAHVSSVRHHDGCTFLSAFANLPVWTFSTIFLFFACYGNHFNEHGIKGQIQGGTVHETPAMNLATFLGVLFRRSNLSSSRLCMERTDTMNRNEHAQTQQCKYLVSLCSINVSCRRLTKYCCPEQNHLRTQTPIFKVRNFTTRAGTTHLPLLCSRPQTRLVLGGIYGKVVEFEHL